MRTLNRYIALTLVKGWILVTVIMLALFGLLQFVQELEHTAASYKTIDAALFVIRTLPQLGLDLAPATRSRSARQDASLRPPVARDGLASR